MFRDAFTPVGPGWVGALVPVPVGQPRFLGRRGAEPALHQHARRREAHARSRRRLNGRIARRRSSPRAARRSASSAPRRSFSKRSPRPTAPRSRASRPARATTRRSTIWTCWRRSSSRDRRADREGVNKIVLTSHLQQIANEQLLATKLSGVDIIVAAGSNTRLGDADDELAAFPGHEAVAGPVPDRDPGCSTARRR